jgi:cytochrome c556
VLAYKLAPTGVLGQTPGFESEVSVHKFIVSLSLLALAACGNPDTPGGRAADARHKHFEALGDSFKVVDDQMKASAPDFTAIRKAAVEIATVSTQLETWFTKGSSKADGLRTHALQAVWDKPEEFKQAAAKFTQEASAFNTVAEGNEKAALGQAMRSLGGACKGCHDKFREPD